MKEFTIEEKAKAYDEALKRASNLHKDAIEMENTMTTKTCEVIFPELKESEGERIRKWLIAQLQIKIGDNATLNAMIYKSIAWLEKQGEQKPIDKVEPKFKVGDWIAGNTDSNLVFKVIRYVDNCHYVVVNKNNTEMRIVLEAEKNYRLWTIQDAKNGDILASKDGLSILIFKFVSFSPY